MKYAAAALLAGVASAGYIPSAEWPAPSSTSTPASSVGWPAPVPSSASSAGGWPVSYSSAETTSSSTSKKASSTPVKYTTEVVTALTTYCPEATELSYGGKTYTIKSATTLTITDCPCTVSHYSGTLAPLVSTSAAPVAVSSPVAVSPVAVSSPVSIPYPVGNTTTWGTPSASVKSSGPAQVTANAANNVAAGAGAALAGVAGAIAYLL